MKTFLLATFALAINAVDVNTSSEADISQDWSRLFEDDIVRVDSYD